MFIVGQKNIQFRRMFGGLQLMRTNCCICVCFFPTKNTPHLGSKKKKQLPTKSMLRFANIYPRMVRFWTTTTTTTNNNNNNSNISKSSTI